MSTKIEWADEVWNPVVGCSQVSAGCRNCYAERMANRLAGMKYKSYQEVICCGVWTGKTVFRESELEKPLHWKRPRRIFVCSMGDLFHESVPDEWIKKVFDAMATDVLQPCKHTYIILTKRPENMLRFFKKHTSAGGPIKWPNVWIGVTAENQETADQRITILLQIPAAVRFVSVEPMLGPVDLELFLQYPPLHDNHKMTFGNADWSGLDWVICGGESGPGARPMHLDWIRNLRDQCQEAEVPFFFKQWGEFAPLGIAKKTDGWARHWSKTDGRFIDGLGSMDKNTMIKIGKKKAGRLLDYRTWEELPNG